MIKIRFGEIDEANINGKKILVDNLARERLIILVSKNTNEFYNIRIKSLETIKRDSRKSFIEIRHRSSDEHVVQLVVDIKHLYNSEYHLNLTNDSKKVLNKCKKCKLYFEKLNHFSITSDNSGSLPLIDVDMIWKQVKQQFGDLFEAYNINEVRDLTFDD